jgi:hypothetical protein
VDAQLHRGLVGGALEERAGDGLEEVDGRAVVDLAGRDRGDAPAGTGWCPLRASTSASPGPATVMIAT